MYYSLYQNNIVKLVLLIMIVSSSACTANGPQYEHQQNEIAKNTNLYIYRPFSLICSAFSPDVYIDEEYYGFISNAGYLTLNLSNGNYTVRIGEQSIKIKMQPDNNVYLKFSHGWNLFFVYPLLDYQLVEVDKKIAESEITTTYYSN